MLMSHAIDVTRLRIPESATVSGFVDKYPKDLIHEIRPQSNSEKSPIVFRLLERTSDESVKMHFNPDV